MKGTYLDNFYSLANAGTIDVITPDRVLRNAEEGQFLL